MPPRPAGRHPFLPDGHPELGLELRLHTTTLENSIQLAGLGLVAAVPVFWRFCEGKG